MPQNPFDVRIKPIDIWKTSNKKKKQNNIFGDNLDVGFGSAKEKLKYKRIPITAEQKKAVLFRQKDKCAYPNCRVRFHRDRVPPHFDHIKRVERGGKNLISNLQALCPNHHQLKTHKENLKKVEKARQKTKKKEYSGGLFGGGTLFGSQMKHSKNNPLGL